MLYVRKDEPLSVEHIDLITLLANIFSVAFARYEDFKKLEKAKRGLENYEPYVKVSTEHVNRRIEIRIKDNGDGIPKDVVDKIFQPFFTTKPTGKGTGLGLSISYDIVTKGHNGSLAVITHTEGSEEAETGTEFIISLPIN